MQLLREPCDIQYFCFPSLQSHLHLTPYICIMASLHLLSAEIQGGGEVVTACGVCECAHACLAVMSTYANLDCVCVNGSVSVCVSQAGVK